MTDEDLARRIMFTVHSGLPREAPGSRESTARALALITDLPEKARILDIGCGPGMQTLDLAALLPEAEIQAVDAHEPFVAEGTRRADAAGCADRVTFHVGDMRALAFPPDSFDLIWCEGAAYIMGVTEALETWRPLVKPGGYLALTDAVWLSETPPQTLLDWWQAEYPAMGDTQACVDKVVNAGYRILGYFVLPESAWWDDYYDPMERRIAGLRIEFENEPAALRELEAHQREIDCYRRWSEHYGYLFVVARKSH
jgi:SAM-dependent methyltransferase